MFRNLLLMLILAVATLQIGCAALAGGAVGAAVGHEIAEEDDEDGDDG